MQSSRNIYLFLNGVATKANLNRDSILWENVDTIYVKQIYLVISPFKFCVNTLKYKCDCLVCKFGGTVFFFSFLNLFFVPNF